MESGARDRSLRVLVVDDNKDAADAVVALLAAHQVRALAAYSGQDALLNALTFDPHLIFLDLLMPQLDGFAVLKSLRKSPRTAATPVVALTAFGSESYRKMALESGFTGLIQKPASADELLAAVRAASG